MSPFVGYAAAGVAAVGCWALIGKHVKIDSTNKTCLVAVVGLAAITAVGLTFGFLPAMTLAGFSFGCFVVNMNAGNDKIQCIVASTILGAVIGVIPSFLGAVIRAISECKGQIVWGIAPNGQLMPIFIPQR